MSAAPVIKIETGSDVRLAGDYAAGHSLGFRYSLVELPSEATSAGRSAITDPRLSSADHFEGGGCRYRCGYGGLRLQRAGQRNDNREEKVRTAQEDLKK